MRNNLIDLACNRNNVIADNKISRPGVKGGLAAGEGRMGQGRWEREGKVWVRVPGWEEAPRVGEGGGTPTAPPAGPTLLPISAGLCPPTSRCLPEQVPTRAGQSQPQEQGRWKMPSVVCILLPPTCRGDRPGPSSRAQSPSTRLAPRMDARTVGSAPRVPSSPAAGTSALSMPLCRPLSQ